MMDIFIEIHAVLHSLHCDVRQFTPKSINIQNIEYELNTCSPTKGVGIDKSMSVGPSIQCAGPGPSYF